MDVQARYLLKLRLAVARFGEMDGAGWWNTQGVLGKIGRSVLSRGFPATHWFAQARIVCSVAAARCASVFAPPGCLTLWSLPGEIEDAFSQHLAGWCRNADEWSSFFEDLAPRNSGELLQHLKELELIDEATAQAARSLHRSAEGRAVALPGKGKADRPTLMLLAAAFSKGERQKLSVPYIRSET